MANTSKLKEALKKYEDCMSKAHESERQLLALIEDFIQEHGRFEFDYDEECGDNNVYALYLTDDGAGKRDCRLKNMYLEDSQLYSDILIRYHEGEGYVDEYEGCPLDYIEFDDWNLSVIVEHIEASCNKK